jgi:hypothetical protein
LIWDRTPALLTQDRARIHFPDEEPALIVPESRPDNAALPKTLKPLTISALVICLCVPLSKSDLPPQKTLPEWTPQHSVRVSPNHTERVSTLVIEALVNEGDPASVVVEDGEAPQLCIVSYVASKTNQREVSLALTALNTDALFPPPSVLETRSFHLIFRQIHWAEEEVARDFAEQIRETLEVMLYSETGAQAALEAGRIMEYDEYTLTVTITDTTENLDRVQRFVESIDYPEASSAPHIDWAAIAPRLSVGH